jgi:hypothetical protein
MTALRDTAPIKLALPAMLLVTLVIGCSQPEPQAKYAVPCEDIAVSVRAEDIGLPADLKLEAGRVMLAADAPSGRFPTGLAVVRINAFTSPKGDERSLRLTEIETHHAIYWSHLLDDLPAIREVVFPPTLGLDPRGYDTGEVLRAAARQNCGLCLIYASVGDTDSDAEYVGGLWDAEKPEPLVAFRAPVMLDPFLTEQLEENSGPTSIVREADFRAEQGFRRLVRDTIWDLAKQDTGAPDLQPSPWRDTDVPLFPRDYEHRRDPRYYPFWRGR